MCCQSEELLIRKKLEKLPGVASIEINMLRREVSVFHTLDSPESVEAALRSIEMDPVPVIGGEEAPEEVNWKKLILAALLALGSEITHLQGLHWAVPLALAAASVLIAGFSLYKAGLKAVINRELNMNALMSVAVTGAVILGDYPEAAMVMVLFTLAEALEDKSLARARAAISGLMSLAPDTSQVEQPDGTFREVKASEIPVGSRVRVRPGEKLAMDGKIVSGHSSVNEASITGESVPAEKGEGDPVFAGTVNESGSFEYVVTEPYENSTLAKILKAVEEAQNTRAPIQRFVDRFASIYTPSVFLAAILIAVLPPLIAGGPWLVWVYRALITLVVACPCALVISTPVTIVSGLAAATRRGLLIKGGTYLEEGRKLKWVAMDKTGTITHGKPVRTDHVALEAKSPEEFALLEASLAARSDHPVSRALFAASGLKESELLPVADFRALPGEGVAGAVNGEELYLGNWRLASRVTQNPSRAEGLFTRFEGEGKSAVALCSRGAVLGVSAVSDTVRRESAEAIRDLESLGVHTVMLTGDNERAAAAAAKEVGVEDFRSGLLPEDKLKIVGELSLMGKTGMAGDGINDAPALAKADIGFAMGAAGTDTAIETAAVAIMDDDLRKIPAFIRLSRETFWHLWENISFSLLVKAAFLALTFFGFTRMYMAVFADIGVCLIVVANGLRLLKK
jgi:Cd2+/Zn2+-exporting ATPase